MAIARLLAAFSFDYDIFMTFAGFISSICCSHAIAALFSCFQLSRFHYILAIASFSISIAIDSPIRGFSFSRHCRRFRAAFAIELSFITFAARLPFMLSLSSISLSFSRITLILPPLSPLFYAIIR